MVGFYFGFLGVSCFNNVSDSRNAKNSQGPPQGKISLSDHENARTVPKKIICKLIVTNQRLAAFVASCGHGLN